MDSTQEDGLVRVPAGTYRIEKLSLGGIHDFKQDAHGQQGVADSVGLYAYPAALGPYDGRDPVSVNLFYRWRFEKM